jgi:hypothetical protein
MTRATAFILVTITVAMTSTTTIAFTVSRHLFDKAVQSA